MVFENLTTTAWVILGAGILLAILGFTKSGKKKSTGQAFLFIGIGLVALMAFAPTAIPDFLGGVTPAAVTIPAAVPTAAPGCTTDDTTVTLSAIDMFTSSASGGTHRYSVNGAPAKTVSDAGTFTASPGDNIAILWGNGTSTTYFGEVTRDVVPCAGTHTFYTSTYQNGSITVSVFNEEGNLIDGVAENETLGAGDTVDLKMELRASSKKGFPHGGILILELNSSDYDEAECYIDSNDLSLRSVAVPSVHTPSSTANKAFAWEVGAFEGTGINLINIHLDVDDTNNPGDANDPTITFRPYDYFVNEDTGGSFDGPAVEDEDNTATFAHSTSTTISVD